jgi:hypothetical protein
VSDSTFIWNGGTGSASSPSNWTLTGGVANSPTNVPDTTDDTIYVNSGDAQFTDTLLPPYTVLTGGQIDMINNGSGGAVGIPSTPYDGPGTLEVTNSIAAVATLTSSGAATNNAVVDVDANGNLTFSVLSGTFNDLGVMEAQNGGILTINSSGGGTFNNAGSLSNNTGVIANGGSVQVNAALGANDGYWGIENGSTIEFNTPVASTGTINFIGHANETLKMDQVATFGGAILGFDYGEVLDFGPINLGTVVYDGTNLTLENPSGGTIAVLDAPNMYDSDGYPVTPGTYAVVNDGTTSDGGMYFATAGNGDEIMGTNPSPALACFAAGTRIATPQGPVAVESLKVGDEVCTVLGGKPQAITWVGHRRIDCAKHNAPRLVWPVRIAAGAFGRGQPSRDLLLSPDHAVYVDGVLIPVKHLLNGATIAQVPCDSVTYHHVELARHDVLLAEDMPAESYLAGADRTVFANHAGVVAMHPDLSSRVWEAEGCAELIVTGTVLDAVRARLDRTARRRHAA